MEQRRGPVRRHPAARARQVAGAASAAAMVAITGWLASQAGTSTTAVTQSADAAVAQSPATSAATNPSTTAVPSTTARTAAPSTTAATQAPTTTAAAAAKAATPSVRPTTRTRGS